MDRCPQGRFPVSGRTCAVASAGQRHPLAGFVADRWLAGVVRPIQKPAAAPAAGATGAVPATKGRCCRPPCRAARLDRHGPKAGRQRGRFAAAGTVRRRGLAARPGGQPSAAARVACPVTLPLSRPWWSAQAPQPDQATHHHKGDRQGGDAADMPGQAAQVVVVQVGDQPQPGMNGQGGGAGQQ